MNRYGLTFWLCHDPGFYFVKNVDRLPSQIM